MLYVFKTMQVEALHSMIAKYPKIVGLAQTYAYADYMVSASRKMDQARRNEFITEHLKGLSPDQKQMVKSILTRRKIKWSSVKTETK